MKTLSTSLATCVAFLMIGALAVAEEAHKVKLVFTTDDASPIVFEGDELGLGETRSLQTDDGRPVTLTRTETGYTVDVDGRSLDIKMPEVPHFEEGQGFRWVSTETEADGGSDTAEKRHIIIHEVHGGPAEVEVTVDGEQKVEKRIQIIHTGDASAQGHPKQVKVMVKGGGNAELKARLVASGALEKLDEETRKKVLDALDSQN